MTLHVLRDCPLAVSIWINMDDIQYRETFFNVNLKQWLNINMNMKLGFDGMKQWTEYWATTCLCLWY
jgi:hypothetical protein